jgi:hypothetical protein
VSRDPWSVLGVPRGSDIATLRAAWKRIARESHPDRNPGDPAAEQRFKDASAAWAALSDPTRPDPSTWSSASTDVDSDLSPLASDCARALEDIAEVLLRSVLPAYFAAYERGLGAELLWRLVRDIDDLTLLDLPRRAGVPSVGARSRANEVLARLHLRTDLRTRVDHHGEYRIADLTLVTDRGLQWAAITVWIGSLHHRGLTDPDRLRVALLPAVAIEIAKVVEARLPADLRILAWRAKHQRSEMPFSLAEARRRDTVDIAIRTLRILLSGVLIATLVWAVLWAATGRLWFW